MRSRPSTSRLLFLAVVSAIVVVYLIGHAWIEQRGDSGSTEAGLVPSVPAADR